MKKKLLGHISVDAGIVWIGDPCYVFHQDKLPEAIGKTWIEFCNILGDNHHKAYNHDRGHEGLGICTSTAHGDGFFPVYGYFRKDNHRPSAIVIEFDTQIVDVFDDAAVDIKNKSTRLLLEEYTKYLQENSYIDTDATEEEPTAIDDFLNSKK